MWQTHLFSQAAKINFFVKINPKLSEEKLWWLGIPGELLLGGCNKTCVAAYCRPAWSPSVTGRWITLYHHSLTSNGFRRRKASSIHRSFTLFWIGVPKRMVKKRKKMFKNHCKIFICMCWGSDVPDKIQRRWAFNWSTALLICALGFLIMCPSSKTTLNQLIPCKGLSFWNKIE